MKRKNIIAYEPIGRIMEQCGALRVSHDAKVVMAKHLEDYASKLSKLAIKYATHAGRNTIKDVDLKLALENL
jgi:histone H3/H4